MATPKKPSLFAQRMSNARLRIKSDTAVPLNVADPVISRYFGKLRLCILVMGTNKITCNCMQSFHSELQLHGFKF